MTHEVSWVDVRKPEFSYLTQVLESDKAPAQSRRQSSLAVDPCLGRCDFPQRVCQNRQR